MATLSFSELQRANSARAPFWCQSGKTPDLSFSIIELGGEVGELLNEVKKKIRFDLGMAGGKDDPEAIEDELGDVVICCSLLANKLGVDLGKCVARKFNKTSRKHDFPVLLPEIVGQPVTLPKPYVRDYTPMDGHNA